MSWFVWPTVQNVKNIQDKEKQHILQFSSWNQAIFGIWHNKAIDWPIVSGLREIKSITFTELQTEGKYKKKQNKFKIDFKAESVN